MDARATRRAVCESQSRLRHGLRSATAVTRERRRWRDLPLLLRALPPAVHTGATTSVPALAALGNPAPDGAEAGSCEEPQSLSDPLSPMPQ